MRVDISVLICTRNRCESLKKTLDSLLNQNVNGLCQYEIIVIDNNSTDQTKKVFEDYWTKFDGRLRYVFEAGPGLSCARNKGIQESEGRIIAFTDDDCIVDGQWVKMIHACAKEIDFDALGGRILPGYPANTPAWVKANADLLCGPIVYHDYGEETKQYERPMIEIVGANMAFKRELFDKYGLFREDLGAGRGTMGEDTEFFKRLEADARKIFYCGKVLVRHPVDLGRVKLSAIARWNMDLAKYRFLVDEHEQVDKNLIYHFGVPRYLIREIIGITFSLITNIFNRRKFLKSWIQMSRRAGKLIEIKKRNKCTKSVS